MHTTNCYGGLTLGAFAGGRLVGYSYALPGCDAGGPFLLSCGLAVARGHGSRGIGEALKRAQAQHALRAGYDVVRWTTNSLASAPLHLYLTKLGARLVRLHADMYSELRDGPFPDEVEIEWDLRHGRRAVASDDAAPLVVAGELRAAELARLSRAGYSVEVPWDRAALAARSPRQARRWTLAVRTALEALLAGGYVGTGVTADRSARLSAVRFERAGR